VLIGLQSVVYALLEVNALSLWFYDFSFFNFQSSISKVLVFAFKLGTSNLKRLLAKPAAWTLA